MEADLPYGDSVDISVLLRQRNIHRAFPLKGHDRYFRIEVGGEKYEVLDDQWLSGYLAFERELSLLEGGVALSAYFHLNVLSPRAALALLPELEDGASLAAISRSVSRRRGELCDFIPEVAVTPFVEAIGVIPHVILVTEASHKAYWAATRPGVGLLVGDHYHAKYPNKLLYRQLAALVAACPVAVRVKPPLDSTVAMRELVLGQYSRQVKREAKELGRVSAAERQRALSTMPSRAMDWEAFATLFSTKLGVANRVVVADAIQGSRPELDFNGNRLRVVSKKLSKSAKKGKENTPPSAKAEELAVSWGDTPDPTGPLPDYGAPSFFAFSPKPAKGKKGR